MSSAPSASDPQPVPSATPAIDAGERTAATASWQQLIQKYKQPDALRASWQLVTTIGSYVAVWVLMWFSLDVSWFLTVPLAVLAGGLMVRVFIIFHDCGHGSFFASRRANDWWGFVTGMLTFTPYYHWRGDHAIHHGTTGDLDRRGIGDVWTMTVQEYIDATPWKRFSYRLSRSPFVLFVIAPFVMFLIVQRIPRKDAEPRERASVWWMNLAVAAMVVGLGFAFGFWPYLVIQLIVLLVAGAAGIWLFYLQHQFEDAYWERGEQWDYAAAAMQGSSFLRLPRILQWFSGNIGFHHIHHLSPRIPNYNLERCHESDPVFRAVQPMTMMQGLRALGLRLWDESSRKLVSFRQARRLRRQRQAAGNATGRSDSGAMDPRS
jgi:acyl-lipid omega-6 desaturase (Delta-12 desaturase)